ncbi:MAG: DUF1343 domain-containing protein, partial [Bacteroidota bacterium]|nr:DUF1343 domain-containing protein [Bacteroidota bacterium]
TLLALGINVKKVFAPEHGFRGDASAGATVKDGKDSRTGIPLVSLYGKNKKPSKAQLEDVDVVIFDIQDVGARFYTYISTMHYVMEACAENGKTFIVFDRPNPNGHFVDGPVLEQAFSSFVGMHPVPLVHGMTVGEYAQMINGEGWLAGGIKCSLQIIIAEGYTHSTMYSLPVPPSPNLPTMASVYLYPSLGLFEGTNISIGRGTDWPFEVVGRPDFKAGNFTFVPRSIAGKAEDPPHLGDTCRGYKLSAFAIDYIMQAREVYLFWVIGFYQAAPDKSAYFIPFFDKLAGTDKLRKQIIEGLDEKQIRASWQEGLQAYRKVRSKYLLYEDF